jgi:hypothetical protein
LPDIRVAGVFGVSNCELSTDFSLGFFYADASPKTFGMQSLILRFDEISAFVQSAKPDAALWAGDASRAYDREVETLLHDLTHLRVQLSNLPAFSLDLFGVAS